MRPKLCARAIVASLSVGFAALAMMSAPAAAGCIAGVGCSEDGPIPNRALYDATCGELWYLRNSAYAENGFCFRSARGRRTFSNAGCTHKRLDDVPLSRIERANVKRIKEVENRRGCK